MAQAADSPDADPASAPVAQKMRFAVRYLDSADTIVNEAAHALGKEDAATGREVQEDMGYLAEWFDNHPKEARAATNYINKRRKGLLDFVPRKW